MPAALFRLGWIAKARRLLPIWVMGCIPSLYCNRTGCVTWIIDRETLETLRPLVLLFWSFWGWCSMNGTHCMPKWFKQLDANSSGSSLITLKLRQSAPTTGSSPTTITSRMHGGPSGPRPGMSTDVHRCPQRCRMQKWLILCDLYYVVRNWIIHDYTVIPYYTCIPQIHWLNLVICSIILGYTRHHCPKIEP